MLKYLQKLSQVGLQELEILVDFFRAPDYIFRYTIMHLTFSARQIIIRARAYTNVYLRNCRFSYAGTWELVNLFVGTKKISYRICQENIGREHGIQQNTQETDTGRTWKVKRSVLNETNKGRNIHSRFQGLKEDQKESCFKTLDDLQNLLIK